MPRRTRNEGGGGCSKDAAPRAAPAARSGKTFDVEGQTITSEADDPWELIGKGEHIYILGNWWNKPPASEEEALEEWITNANAQWKCELVGYVEEWTHGDGEEAPAYIIKELSENRCYAMRVNDVRRRLPQRLQPVEVESDDEAPEIDAEDEPARRGRGNAPDYGPNKPRLGDEYAGEIKSHMATLHGVKEEAEGEEEEECDEDGDVRGVTRKKGQRKPGPGWEEDTGTPDRNKCTASAKLELKAPIPRNRLPRRGQPIEWTMLDSLRVCWPVIALVAAQSNLYYDQETALWGDDDEEMDDEQDEDAVPRGKKPTLGSAKWPTREMNMATGEMEGGITELMYLGYCGIIIFMGIVRCRDMSWHWCTNVSRMQHALVRSIMPREFFLLMRRFLHFADSSKKIPRGDRSQPPPKGYDMIFNFRPVMDACNVAWVALVCVVGSLAYDEQMVKMTMHTGLGRRQPNKPIKYGFQIYVIAAACGPVDVLRVDRPGQERPRPAAAVHLRLPRRVDPQPRGAARHHGPVGDHRLRPGLPVADALRGAALPRHLRGRHGAAEPHRLPFDPTRGVARGGGRAEVVQDGGQGGAHGAHLRGQGGERRRAHRAQGAPLRVPVVRPGRRHLPLEQARRPDDGVRSQKEGRRRRDRVGAAGGAR